MENFENVLPGKGGKKVHIFRPGHMTMMADMPIYNIKTLKNLLLQNHCADCLETRYVASWVGWLVVFGLKALLDNISGRLPGREGGRKEK